MIKTLRVELPDTEVFALLTTTVAVVDGLVELSAESRRPRLLPVTGVQHGHRQQPGPARFGGQFDEPVDHGDGRGEQREHFGVGQFDPQGLDHPGEQAGDGARPRAVTGLFTGMIKTLRVELPDTEVFALLTTTVAVVDGLVELSAESRRPRL